jgi:hypothetical protein
MIHQVCTLRSHIKTCTWDTEGAHETLVEARHEKVKYRYREDMRRNLYEIVKYLERSDIRRNLNLIYPVLPHSYKIWSFGLGIKMDLCESLKQTSPKPSLMSPHSHHVPHSFGHQCGRRQPEEWGPIMFFVFTCVFFGFCLPSDIGEVVATTTRWNEDSPASPYLEGICFNINKGLMRVCVVKSADVSVKGNNWLVIGTETSTPYLSCFVVCPVSTTLWIGSEGLQAYVASGVGSFGGLAATRSCYL